MWQTFVTEHLKCQGTLFDILLSTASELYEGFYLY